MAAILSRSQCVKTKGKNAWASVVSLLSELLDWTSSWTNSLVTSDLRVHGTQVASLQWILMYSLGCKTHLYEGTRSLYTCMYMLRYPGKYRMIRNVTPLENQIPSILSRGHVSSNIPQWRRMSVTASQITGNSTVRSTACSGWQQKI